MIKGKTQIHEGELHEIRVLLIEGYSIPKIAEKLGRSKSTLYRLFQNNGVKYNQPLFQYVGGKKGNREKEYVIRVEGKSQVKRFRKIGKRQVRFIPKQIYDMREERRSLASRRHCRIEPGGKLENYILLKIKNAWSPKQISGRWRLETLEKLSKDTIYRHIYSHHKDLIRKYFRRKGKRYLRHRDSKYRITERRMIEERKNIFPKCETREEIGHWEGDTIVGIKGGSKEVILTNVERKTGYLLTRKLNQATGQCVMEATTELYSDLFIPTHKKLSITYDNGREFSEHRMIEFETRMIIFFAHPYHSWERGTNENTNGLLRQFIPKKTDFKYTSEEQLQYYTDLINHRPRERLGFLTPYEVFIEGKSCIGL